MRQKLHQLQAESKQLQTLPSLRSENESLVYFLRWGTELISRENNCPFFNLNFNCKIDSGDGYFHF